MRSAIRRTVAAAAVIPVLALAAACNDGNGTDSSGKDAKPTTPATGTGPDGLGNTLTKAQLEKALVTSADLPGFVVKKNNEQMDPKETQKADKQECQPIADVPSTTPRHARKAYTGNTVTKKDVPTTGDDMQGTIELLASYEPGEADQVMTEVKKSLKTCLRFTAKDGAGRTTGFVVKPQGEPKAGDEAVEFELQDTGNKRTGDATVTLVRTGTTLATYVTLKAGGHGVLPLELATKQHEKLKALPAGS